MPQCFNQTRLSPSPIRVGLLLLVLFPPPVLALTENFVPEMGDYVFFTFVICAVLFSALTLTAMGAFRWLVYAGFGALMILNSAAMGGVISYLVGPTDFNLFVVPYLRFGAVTTYGFWVAGWLLDEHHRLARFRRWFYVLSMLAAIGPLTSYLWLRRIPLNLMWIPEQVLYVVMILGQILPPLTWQSMGRTQRRLVLAFPVVIALFILFSAGAGELFLDLSREGYNVLSRISVSLFLSFAMVLVLWQAFAAVRARQMIERQALEAARKEAELKLALVESERQYDHARSLASQQRSQLAKVSHDLKQPISALRMAVGGMSVEEDKSHTLNRAIDYVDQLAQSFVQSAASSHVEEDESLGSGVGDAEAVSTDLFAQSLEQMFSDEARGASIQLKVRSQPGTITAVPLVLMRIFMNLVANALAHAEASRVLVVFRRRSDHVLFAVYDNGVGMDQAGVARALAKGGKRDGSAGDGLGLSIVQDLCEAHGFEFALRSEPGRGTVVTVACPRSDD